MIKPLSDLFGWKYQYILKPVLFQFDPEFVHNRFVQMGKVYGAFPLTRKATELLWGYQDKRIAKTIDGIHFPNPVGLSAGFDYNGELTDILPAVGFGWHTLGTITNEPYGGNPKPRLGRLPDSKALIVNKGLKNRGARALIPELEKKNFSIPTGISIASTNKHFKDEKEQIKDILQCFRRFERSRIKHAYYELNISCPNTFGGEPFFAPAKLKRLLRAVDGLKIKKPIYIKFPIDQNWTDSKAALDVIAKSQINGVILGNLTKDRQNPAVTEKDRRIWQQRKGNLSGKPTWERSNTLIKKTRQAYGDRFTIVGTGGIFTPEDAAHKLSLGADLVQLITGMIFQGPQLIGQINHHLANQE